MKTVLKALLIAVAAVAGLAVGFAWRGQTVPGAAEVSAVKPASAVSTTDATPASNAMGWLSVDANPATKLERDLSMSSGVTRWLYWFEALEKATPDDFPRLRRLAEGNAAATRLVVDRWIELYPQHAFETIAAAVKAGQWASVRDLSFQLFRDWPRRDPDAAIAAVSAGNDLGMRDSWRISVASAVVEIDPERGLRLLGEWHILNFGPRMNGVAKWAAADPRHAAEFTLANPAGYASAQAIETIAKEWAKTDPAAAMQFSVGKSGLADTLAATALKSWAARSLNDAAGWVAAADPRTRDRLGVPLAEVWAKTDANAALAWCEANLSGTSLAGAVGGVVKGVADKDLNVATALVTSMNPSPARAEAAAAVSRKLFPDISREEPMKPEMVAWISALDPASIEGVLNEVSWHWAVSDPKSLAAFLAGTSERYARSAYTITARELVHRNPMEALDWVQRLPQDRGLSAGADAFGEWYRSQPDAAMNWFNQLPPGDSRRQPYVKGAITQIVWDSSDAAAKLAALSAPERATARTVIDEMKNLPDDRRARLLEAVKAQ